VWGARTLTSDPSWRYLTVRKLVTYLEQSILEGTGWVVLEPNDSRLWATIRGRVSAFLTNEWRNGASIGMTPSEAFYVTCDEETNPPDVIAAGDVVFDVGIAPVKPSEFVTLRLSQSSAGSA
jgi:phage tail sheath protein FI